MQSTTCAYDKIHSQTDFTFFTWFYIYIKQNDGSSTPKHVACCKKHCFTINLYVSVSVLCPVSLSPQFSVGSNFWLLSTVSSTFLHAQYCASSTSLLSQFYASSTSLLAHYCQFNLFIGSTVPVQPLHWLSTVPVRPLYWLYCASPASSLVQYCASSSSLLAQYG